MATTNIILTRKWQLVVPSGTNFILTSNGNAGIEIAVSFTTPSDTLVGHLIDRCLNQAINREVIGDGDIYARSTVTNTPTIAVVSVW
jgi:hypothetical protein